MFQMGGVGPMMGQLGGFKWRDDKIPYAIERYTNETNRYIQACDRHFANRPVLADSFKHLTLTGRQVHFVPLLREG